VTKTFGCKPSDTVVDKDVHGIRAESLQVDDEKNYFILCS